MAINKITNTPIIAKHYSSLSLRQTRTQTHSNVIRQSDGTLWAALAFPGDRIHVYQSTDNGFSWVQVITDIVYNQRDSTTISCKGPLVFLVIEEQYRNLDLISVEWEGVGETWILNRNRYQLDALTEAPTASTGLLDGAGWEGQIAVCFNHKETFCIYTDGGGNLTGFLLSHRSTSMSAQVDYADNVSTESGVATVCDENSKVYCIYRNSDSDELKHNIFSASSSSGSWGVATTVADLEAATNFADDMVICRDGYETLGVAYALRDDNNETTDIYFTYSTDDGANWTTASGLFGLIDRKTGYSQYEEPVNSVGVSYLDMIAAADGGFMLTYCDVEDDDGWGHTFVREISTVNSGVDYTVGSQEEIGTKYNERDVIGGHFFRPPDVKLMDFRDPGLVRLAYTVDEGTEENGLTDMEPVTIAQELLSECAFPSPLTTDTGSYTEDTAGSDELLVSFSIVGSPQDNLDFYAAGLTGNQTRKYMAAFAKMGTNARLLRYEPDAVNFMNDRSAYDSPLESSSLVLFDPISYASPTPQITAEGAEAWIERDTRKIYFPPDLHLERTFIINNGGYLKRTVWLTEYDGNQYEISQVVPRFISHEICYYEANAYVVGPSRDPFSRVILPSET